MNTIITPHKFSGVVRIPASKSHTIRALLIASLAEGESRIYEPLESLDAASCVQICRALGADIIEIYGTTDNTGQEMSCETGSIRKSPLREYRVRGIGGKIACPQIPLDTGNSGTTLFFALALAALGKSPITFTGDEQIKRRSAGTLLASLNDLGADVASNEGYVPATVCGPWRGGHTSIECPTSQYLSALLLAAPLAPAAAVTEIDVPLLYEKPYIEMTLSYLQAQRITFECAEDFSYFRIPGGQHYNAVSRVVPADFSSAAFPALAAVVSGGTAILTGLDPQDTQGDKFFFDMLTQMGAEARWENTDGANTVTVLCKRRLSGGIFDLNNTPDMLPAACILGAYAQGETYLVNVENARIKETDRIAVMARELGKLGVRCRELSDGIVIQGSGGKIPCQKAPLLDGHGDHRIVMALACAALGMQGPSEISDAEAADVTYPGFLDLLRAGNAD